MNVWLDEFSKAWHTHDHYPDQEIEHYQNLWCQFPLILDHHSYAHYQGVSARIFHILELYKLLIADQHTELLENVSYISRSSKCIQNSTITCCPTLLPFLVCNFTITSQLIILAFFFSFQNILTLLNEHPIMSFRYRSTPESDVSSSLLHVKWLENHQCLGSFPRDLI